LKELDCTDGLPTKPETVRPCTIETTMGQYQNYFPEYAFDNDPGTYYWTNRSPRIGDLFTIRFHAPMTGVDKNEKRVNLHLHELDDDWITVHEIAATEFSVGVETGKPLDPGHDCLLEGVVEVLTTRNGEWMPVGYIRNGYGQATAAAQEIWGFRLRVTKGQPEWLALRKMDIVPTLVRMETGSGDQATPMDE
jgi:hypothetical protein